MDRTSYTGPLDALAGRVIDTIQLLGTDEDGLLIAFTDGNYLLFVPEYSGYDSDLTIQQRELADWQQRELGWLTQEEYDLRQARLSAARLESRRKSDLRRLASLKTQYE